LLDNLKNRRDSLFIQIERPRSRPKPRRQIIDVALWQLWCCCYRREDEMAGLNISVQHQLLQADSLRRVKGLLGEVQKEFADKISNLSESWGENKRRFSFTTPVGQASGTITVGASSVDLAVNLPLLAGPFRGKIETAIRERARKLLA